MRALVACAWLAALPVAAQGLPDEAYRCKLDVECVVVPSPCEVVVVHRDFLAAARKQKRPGCLGTYGADRPFCRAGRCSAEIGAVGKPVPRLPESLGHHFGGDPARFAKWWDDPKRDARQKPDEVVRLMAVKRGMTLVDVGAGTGYFLARLSAAAGPKGKVLALDIEPQMIAWLEARIRREKLANASARRVAADDPGLGDASVDRVLVVNTWHHIGARAAYAQRVRRALRPGGKLVIVDFTLDTKEGPPRAERLTAEQVAAELEQIGLHPEIAAESLPDHFVVVGSN